MKKKIYAMALSLTLALSMAACGSPEVSGPVDREPITSTDAKTPEDVAGEGVSPEGASTEESSAVENSSALADWYNSNDRKKQEDILNQMYADSGITLSISIEEPDVIIWTYQYNEPISDESNREALYNYFYNSMDSQYQTYVEGIKRLKDDGIPVTTFRWSYLDADGTDLCTMDFTEDYVPSTDNTFPSQEKASLEDWMNSEDQKLVVFAVNSQLASAGISIDFYAEGNVMVMDYTYTEQQDLEGMSQEDITSVFDDQIVSNFSGLISSLFDTFESEYGLVLDDIKLIFRNADGTELYSKYFSEL